MTNNITSIDHVFQCRSRFRRATRQCASLRTLQSYLFPYITNFFCGALVKLPHRLCCVSFFLLSTLSSITLFDMRFHLIWLTHLICSVSGSLRAQIIRIYFGQNAIHSFDIPYVTQQRSWICCYAVLRNKKSLFIEFNHLQFFTCTSTNVQYINKHFEQLENVI